MIDFKALIIGDCGSGLWRGHSTPDWYHYEGWPLRWGIGILQGIEAAHQGMNDQTAVKRPAIRY